MGRLSRLLDRRRLLRVTIILKPATLLRFHRMLRDLKYRCLYSSQPNRKRGPEGPSVEPIQAICELKRRNPRLGCPKITQLLVGKARLAHSAARLVNITVAIMNFIFTKLFSSPAPRGKTR